MNDTASLETALDAFAQDILAKARLSDSLPEMLKAFEVVGRFAEQRAKAQPPTTPAEQGPKESKFARIKHQFNGTDGNTPTRRTRRAAAATDDPAGSA